MGTTTRYTTRTLYTVPRCRVPIYLSLLQLVTEVVPRAELGVADTRGCREYPSRLSALGRGGEY
eukprot:scaffold66518_cov52-Phaeocystis_antarctica.AAC.8